VTRSSEAAGFLLALVKELRWRVAASALVALAVAFMEGTGVLLIIPLLASIGLTVNDGSTSGLASSVEAIFVALGLTPTLGVILIVFLLVTAAHAALYRTYLVINPVLEQQFGLVLRQRLYDAIVHARWSYLTRKRMSDLVHATTHEVDRATAAAYQLFTFVTGLIVSGIYVAIAFRLSPALTSVVGAGGVILLWSLRHRTRHSGELGEKYREATSSQFHLASESLNGLKVTRSLGAEQRNIELFRRQAHVRAASYLDLLRSFARSKMTLDLASAALVTTLLYVSVQWLGLRGGALLMLIFIFSRVMPRAMTLQAAAQTVSANIPSFVAVMRLIEECAEHAENAEGAEGAEHAERKFDLPIREVRFKHVSYAYDGDVPQVLDDVSLSINAARTTAIVGASGAGKSTLADLLIGLLRPATGSIVVNGRNLSDADLGAWRRAIGYVPQEGFLFHDTIRQNLQWARPDATDAEMWRALENAAAADFVRAKPEGLDTIVGDRGVRLSGGECQRLALARALLTRPDLLVLDEATSSLDPLNEQLILDAVRRLGGSVTTVIITHRLAAIRDADVIYVLESGTVIESGSWRELVARNGAFARLLRAQEGPASGSRLPASAAAG
jgi:ATP-binding cassette, subfamily C, bacterial